LSLFEKHPPTVFVEKQSQLLPEGRQLFVATCLSVGGRACAVAWPPLRGRTAVQGRAHGHRSAGVRPPLRGRQNKGFLWQIHAMSCQFFKSKK